MVDSPNMNVKPRKIKWLLTASLILNLFLISGIAAGAYRLFLSDHAVFGNQTARGLRFAADDLPAERQHMYRKVLREARRDARPLIKSGQDARSEVRSLLAAPTFDREAVTAALNKTHEADMALRIRIEQSLLDFVEVLSPEERATFADGLAKQGPLRQALLRNQQADAATTP
ncbi:MAG: periplasmic heavy metal sensor [Methylophilaceae bacterium]|nr:periplasmic heavy metal sensor [Methyloradius sp.]